MMRKRAPGGGRKPKGAAPVRSQLTVRIPDELRAALEENVARRRKRKPSWNLTEEILGRLYWSYRRQEEERRDPYMKALAFLISAIADNVNMRRSLVSEWHRDPFMFRAFKRGVVELLDALEPAGEARPHLDIEWLRQSGGKLHQLMADQSETPEAAGAWAARQVLGGLYRFAPEPEKWTRLREMEQDPRLMGFAGTIADRMEEEFYAMSNVRRVLGIKEPKGGKL